MKTNLVLAAALFGAGLGLATPSSAMPVGAPGLSGPDSTLIEARSTRMERRMMRSNRAMRMRNKARSSQAGNARNPKRMPMRQNQGGTTGGSRY